MEDERIVSGFCRRLDQSRRVLCEYEQIGGRWAVSGTDCLYPDCPFASECPLAAEFTKLPE